MRHNAGKVANESMMVIRLIAKNTSTNQLLVAIEISNIFAESKQKFVFPFN